MSRAVDLRAPRRSHAALAVQLCIPCADLTSAWREVESLARAEPWCLEIEALEGQGARVHALFATLPQPRWATHVVPARAAVFGSGWRAAQGAAQVGPLWVLPPGRRPPCGARRVVVVEALKAFGAGSHDTTLLCLERVVELSPAREVLDVGTGSGVLAIAALLLGAERATGIDLDDVLLAEAQKNAAHSGVAARYHTTRAPPEQLGRAVSLVLANVRTPALVSLAPALWAAVEPGGALILSGVRVEEEGEVLPTYSALGVHVDAVVARGDWLRIDLSRPA